MSDSATVERAYFVQVLMRLVREYFDLRVAHLFRAKPPLRSLMDDFNFQLLHNMQKALDGTKSYGADKTYVAILAMGDDNAKRRGLLNPTDQNTLINEVVEKAEDPKLKQTAAAQPLASLRMLAGRYDPEYEKVVETLQALLWMDLPDVFDYGAVEVASNYLTQILKARAIPDPVRESINRQLNRPQADPLELEDAVLLLFHRVRHYLDLFAIHRREEPVYMMAIRREAAPAASEEINQLLLVAGGHLQSIRQLQSAGGMMTGDQQQGYARAMGTASEHVTAERALAWENTTLGETKKMLAEKLAAASSGGAPYDYKMQQLVEAKKRFDQYTQHLTQAGVDLQKPPPKPRAEK